MKRHADLWAHVVAWPNLLLAAHKASRGKRDRPVVQRFRFGREWLLLQLQTELLDGSYRPGEFTTHRITRPKPRLISAAPFRDRVVHHAILNVLEPIFEKRFYPHSYACRKGKGTHAAVRHLQRQLHENAWLLPCDVRQFFPSIDHAILKEMIRRLIKDTPLLALLDQIVDRSNPQDDVPFYFPGDDLFTPQVRRRGLPIGNLTSQWLANLYLDGLDHHLTSRLRVGGYVRYCDDFILLDNDRERLKDLRAVVIDFTAGVRLKIHEDTAQIRPRRCGITYVGYRVWATHCYLPKESIKRQKRRVRWMQAAYARGALRWKEVVQRMQSWLGHVRQADSKRLVQRLMRGWKFRRRRPPPA